MWASIILLSLTCRAMAAPAEEEAFQEFATGNRRFTASVYHEILKEEKGNFIVSPFSAETVLALTQEGARGETAQEFATGLSLPNTTEKTRQAFKTLLPKLKNSEEMLKLLSANKIYVGNDVELENEFKSIATTVYDSSVDNIDFSQSVQAADTINGWVEDNTNHKIRNLLKPSQITLSTKIILVNALYFSGKWVIPFDEDTTKKRNFYKSENDVVEIDTMQEVGYFNYYENPALNTQFLELSYKGGNISMVVVLPNEKEGLARLEKNVEQLLQPQPLSFQRVDVHLPKFTTETEIKFVPILKKLGINRIFNGNLADLSGLSSTHKDLFVSDVVQKAFINVTETGTEAAAATSVLAVLGFAPQRPPVKFYADHPFLYYIKSNGIVLFTGRQVNPAL